MKHCFLKKLGVIISGPSVQIGLKIEWIDGKNIPVLGKTKQKIKKKTLTRILDEYISILFKPSLNALLITKKIMIDWEIFIILILILFFQLLFSFYFIFFIFIFFRFLLLQVK